ncbi:MAG: hypothetical protein K2X35_17225 [Bryobacteraceae bacterium]|nr:hypothetical protein [Bryobacteraceae bacterium]
MRAVAILSLALAGVVWADHHRITLRDGTNLEGRFVQGNAQRIIFEEEDGRRRTIPVTDISRLEFGQGGHWSSNNNNTWRDSSGPSIRIPAGRELVVRTNERIESQTATTGRTYSAVVEKDVEDESGRIAIPRGAEANLVVRDAGNREIALDLESVMTGGRRYAVSTSDMERSSREGIGANRRTGIFVGGGAAIGTLIGAAAGGGRGALIGAIAGAAAGAGTQVLTRGKEVKIAPETQLTFRLDQPLVLQAMR